jgi:hypothetical protein
LYSRQALLSKCFSEGLRIGNITPFLSSQPQHLSSCLGCLMAK